MGGFFVYDISVSTLFDRCWEIVYTVGTNHRRLHLDKQTTKSSSMCEVLGQVMLREGLDGKEMLCLNCGSNQLPPVPAPVLSKGGKQK